MVIYMKILFIGRGVIATQYAWAFEKAGHSVEFYVRPGRKAEYGDYVDLEIWDARKSMKRNLVKERWKIVCQEEIDASKNYDLIIVSVNTHQIADVISYLSPRIGTATVLFFHNFWQEPLSLVQPIPIEQIVWGFPGAGGGFSGHTLKGGFMKMVFFGTLGRAASNRDQEVQDLFITSGFKINKQKDIRSWFFNHQAINVAIEIEVMKCGSFHNLMTDTKALASVGKNVKEIIPVIKAKQAKIDPITNLFAYFPSKLLGFVLSKLVFAPKSLPRLLMESNNSTFGYGSKEVLVDAKKYHIKMPRLEKSINKS